MYGKIFRPKNVSVDEDEEDEELTRPLVPLQSEEETYEQPRKIIIPDRSLRNGDAKKRLSPFLSGTSSSSSSFEGVKKKKNTKKASGRLEGNSLIIDEIRDDYDRLTPSTAISKHKPPEYPTPSESEVAEALQWAKSRMDTKRKVREDRIYQFLLKYAGYSFRNMSRVATSPAQFRGGGGYGSSSGGLAPQVTAPPFTPPRQPQFFSAPGSPSDAPSGLFPPGTPFNMTSSAPFPSFPPPPPGAPGVPPPPINPEVERAQRAVQIAEWIQKPAVIGQWELSEDVFSHAELAFAMLQMRVSHFLEVPDMVSFMESKVDVVHTYFAMIAVYASNANAFYNPTRTPLDKNKKRLNRDIGFLVDALSKFKWDSFARDFRLQGARGFAASRTARSSSGYPLPSYILSNPLPKY